MLNEESIKWAIDFTCKYSDGDLFPQIPEINAILAKKDEFATILSAQDLSKIQIGAHRRFIVPKEDLSYRQATQLSPQDSIILAAIVYQYGELIEKRRLSDTSVFSYRFSPDLSHGLYAEANMWNKFWMAAYEKSRPLNCKAILYCDIADFYNQIYHHTIENQLIDCGFPNQITKWVIRLFESTTAGVSRGVPIGPHAVHLLAEATMIPIDNSLRDQGISFIRYVDDIIIFCENEKHAKLTVPKIATILDKQQRLILQRHKVKIFKKKEFGNECERMIEDRPISKTEDNVLKVINKYSRGNPYILISYEDISEEDWNNITEEIINGIISDYLSRKPIDYIRLRWFYRRLTQIRHPGAVSITLSRIKQLSPCIANICVYLASAQLEDNKKWKVIGTEILKLLDSDEIACNEYFRLLLLSLFTHNEHINHFSNLANRYSKSDAFVKREILLAAKCNLAFDWLREQKENFQNMEFWQQSAFIYSIAGLPKDEKKYYINKQHLLDPYMQILAKWAKEQ